MDFKVIFQPLALDDLEGIVRHVAEKDLQAANRLGRSLLDQAESLAQFPERGGNVRRRPGVKKLVRTPHLIFYRVDDTRRCVDVLRFCMGLRTHAVCSLSDVARAIRARSQRDPLKPLRVELAEGSDRRTGLDANMGRPRAVRSPRRASLPVRG
jgi:plasmid stabilization system protein ParE